MQAKVRAPKCIKQMLTDLKGGKEATKWQRTAIPHFSNEYIIQTENKQGNIGLEPYLRAKGPNTHVYNISSNSGRIHILLKYTRNILQPQNKS